MKQLTRYGLTMAAAAITWMMANDNQLQAQSRLNFGLTRPQPTNTLPKGKAPFDKPLLKKKTTIATTPKLVDDNTYTINNGWELADGETVINGSQSPLLATANTSKWYNATVPGTVLTTLVDQGVYPDPYIGLNNMAIPDTLARKDWWYRLSFDAPKQEAGKLAWLQFNGINYKAQVWLNGVMLGTINGAFVRGVFDVTKHLKATGKNILAVHILPPANPGIPHEQSNLAGMGPNGGQLALDGPTFISSEGWDWVPGIRDRNIGIWQDVQLKYTGAVTLSDPQIITSLPLPDTTSASITIKATVKNHTATASDVTLSGSIENIKFSTVVMLQPNEEKQVILAPQTHASLQVKNPRLWWPNGYGRPELYNLNLQLTSKNNVLDEAKVRFGIREFSYELMADAPQQKSWRFDYSPTKMEQHVPLLDNTKRRDIGSRIFISSIRDGINTSKFTSLQDTANPYLVVKVNGRKIFCKGGNWGMDDGMKRVSKERLEPAFKLHREANYNMIRNWTGESTQESFYALADEYGLLVWNDFWISTEGYNLNPIDQQLWLANSLEVIRRFRNHASIAIWCPRNEGYAPSGIEDELAMQLAVEDGTRHYIGNSREMNLRQSGDWHYVENYKEYFTKYADGFSTEIGTFSVPVASTIRKFIKPQDQWPINDVWHYHDLHSNNQNLPGYLKAVDSLYGKATGLDDFSKKVQLINYDTHRAMFEAWNSKQWDNASGVLLWMTHPAWPSMIWQTYSWDFETHGSYFGAKKACEPLHIQMNLHDNKIIVTNQSLNSYDGAVAIINIFDVNGKSVYTNSHTVNVPMNNKVDVIKLDPPSMNLPTVYMIRLQLTNKSGSVLDENSYWKTSNEFTAFNQLSNVSLTGKAINVSATKAMVMLENKSNVPAIGIKLNLVDEANNIVLPAYFSDGYFTLLPGEQKNIMVEYPSANKALRIKTDGYNNTTSYIQLKK
jgi:hypothetical protein